MKTCIRGHVIPERTLRCPDCLAYCRRVQDARRKRASYVHRGGHGGKRPGAGRPKGTTRE